MSKSPLDIRKSFKKLVKSTLLVIHELKEKDKTKVLEKFGIECHRGKLNGYTLYCKMYDSRLIKDRSNRLVQIGRDWRGLKESEKKKWKEESEKINISNGHVEKKSKNVKEKTLGLSTAGYRLFKREYKEEGNKWKKDDKNRRIREYYEREWKKLSENKKREYDKRVKELKRKKKVKG